MNELESQHSSKLSDGARRSVFHGAVDVVRIAAFGFELDRHVFDAES
jgi:hypothetical protein